MFPEWITFSAQNWITLTALQTPVSVNTLPRCTSFPGLLSEVKDGTRSPTGAGMGDCGADYEKVALRSDKKGRKACALVLGIITLWWSLSLPW